MRNDSLDGAFAKLQRGRNLLAAVEAVVPQFDGTPFAYHPIARVETGNEGREYRFFVGDIEPLDSTLQFLAGECLFNARSALDHLVYQLHFGRYRGHIPESVRRDSMFPIIANAPRDSPSRWRGIRALSERDRRAIAWLQPYVTRNDELSGVRYELDVLEKLHVIDKHRVLHIVRQIQTAAMKVNFSAQYGFQEHRQLGKPPEPGTEMFRWVFEIAPPQDMVESKLGAYGGAFSEVSICEDSEFFTLVPTLRAITNRVEDVLTRFAHRFD